MHPVDVEHDVVASFILLCPVDVDLVVVDPLLLLRPVDIRLAFVDPVLLLYPVDGELAVADPCLLLRPVDVELTVVEVRVVDPSCCSLSMLHKTWAAIWGCPFRMLHLVDGYSACLDATHFWCPFLMWYSTPWMLIKQSQLLLEDILQGIADGTDLGGLLLELLLKDVVGNPCLHRRTQPHAWNVTFELLVWTCCSSCSSCCCCCWCAPWWPPVGSLGNVDQKVVINNVEDEDVGPWWLPSVNRPKA